MTYVKGPTVNVDVPPPPAFDPLSNHIAFAIIVIKSREMQQDNR